MGNPLVRFWEGLGCNFGMEIILWHRRKPGANRENKPYPTVRGVPSLLEISFLQDRYHLPRMTNQAAWPQPALWVLPGLAASISSIISAIGMNASYTFLVFQMPLLAVRCVEHGGGIDQWYGVISIRWVLFSWLSCIKTFWGPRSSRYHQFSVFFLMYRVFT